MEMSQILVPTDFSSYSEKAFMNALTLASHYKASITLLHAIEPPYDFASTVESTLEQMKRSCRRRLEGLVKKAIKNEKFKDIHIDTMLVTGASRTAIREATETKKADLIVIGSQGASGMRKKLLGSVAADVALKSSKPVLIVPEGEGEPGFRNILFATDYRDGDLESLTYLASLASNFDSDIHIVNVAEKESLESEMTFRGFREAVIEKIPYKKFQFELYFDKDPFLGLSRYMENKDIGLLVITRYKRTVLETLFAKNHTRKMSYYSTIPLLIIPGI